MVEPRLSTVLALASRAVEYRDGEWRATRLKSIGMRGFRELTNNADNGIHIIFGSEEDNPSENLHFICNLKIEIEKQSDETERITRLFTIVNDLGVGEFAVQLSPGSYWLSFKSENKKPIKFSVVILRERVTLFVMQKNLKGDIEIAQYLPRPKEENHHEDIKRIRNLSMLEEYYSTDILEYFYEDVLALAYDKFIEPMAGCVAGYLMLQNFNEKNSHSLGTITYNMTTYFEDIPDSFVLKGRYESFLEKDESAKDSFKIALNRGVPVFTEGLIILYNAMMKNGLTEERYSKEVKRAHNHRIRNSLWTSYAQ